VRSYTSRLAKVDAAHPIYHRTAGVSAVQDWKVQRPKVTLHHNAVAASRADPHFV